MEYRREIDGLRAIAVIPVIFFHAGFESFSGGFVGVDVFFVISGYLITSIVIDELDRNCFSIVSFYERRARRILPALFFVMLICLPAAWLILPPIDFKDFSQSLVAVSLFSSNILFWMESGYFSTAAELKPLLHTWSLAVEEQYYVIFPIFLMLIWRLGRYWVFVGVVLVGAASLALSEFVLRFDPSFAFFMLPTRAWELMVGGLAAIHLSGTRGKQHAIGRGGALNDVLGMVGVVLIGIAVAGFDESTPFPGKYALVPTLGTVLVILFASRSTGVGKVLGSQSLVQIGLISYSAYLWHQPLFAFARHGSLTDPSPMIFMALSAGSIILAYMSWRFVEQPFRKKRLFTRMRIFGLSVAGTGVFLGVGITGHLTQGFETRIPGTLAAELRMAESRAPNCIASGNGVSFPERTCVLVEGSRDQIAIIGDSQAAALAESIASVNQGQGFGVFSRTYNACPPFEELYRMDRVKSSACNAYNEATWRFVMSAPAVTHVVLIARWTLNLEGSRFNNGEGGNETGKPAILGVIEGDGVRVASRSEIKSRYKKKIEDLLAAGKKVVLVYPIPEMGWSVPDYIAKWVMRTGRDYSIEPSVASTSHAAFVARNRGVYEVFDSIRDSENLARVVPEHLLCNEVVVGRCVAHRNGAILYKDDDHLSDAGARLLAGQVAASVGALGR